MPFIIVRYGDDKSEMFNPNCRNIILLNSIKQRCHCNDDVYFTSIRPFDYTTDIIDLTDETGSICHLPSHLQEYGKNYLIDRTNYVLVKMETKMEENGDVRITYTPLLDGMSDNKEVMDRLNPRPVGKGKGKLRRTASSLSNDSKGSEKRTRKISAARKITGVLKSLSAAKK